MNNLKFRAFDPVTKRIIKPSFDLVIEFHTNPFGEAYTVVFEDNKKIENAIVMQSTGLFDKHSVEIFEGDIVKEEFGRFQQYIVKWDEHGGLYPFSGTEYGTPNIGVRVIGNIYSNPELLEQN